MAFTHEVFEVTDEAALIIDGGNPRDTVVIYNPAGNPTVYFGGPAVTDETGQPIPAGQRFAVDIEDDDDKGYVVVAAGTCDLRVLRRG